MIQRSETVVRSHPRPGLSLRGLLQLLSLVLFTTALFWWFAAGPNAGWTKTSVPVKTTDEVTGLEAITYQQRFVPGLDFLGATALGAGLLAAVSFFLNRHTKPEPHL